MKYVFRAIVAERFYYYWNREKADWYGGLDMATRYEQRPRTDPPSNADRVNFITEQQARSEINKQ